MGVDFAGNYGGSGPYAPFRNPYSYNRVFGGQPVLFRESWDTYGASGVIVDTPAAAAVWTTGEIATCGPGFNAAGNYIQNGIVSSGNASYCRRTIDPAIDYTKYHSIKADFISIAVDGCFASVGLEGSSTLNQGQSYLKVRQLSGNKELSIFVPTLGATVVETVASAVGNPLTELMLVIFPLNSDGLTRSVRVYRDGNLKGVYTAGVPGAPTNMNVACYFNNAGVNAANRCSIGRVTVRGTT